MTSPMMIAQKAMKTVLGARCLNMSTTDWLAT